MKCSSSSNCVTPPCSPQARAKRSIWCPEVHLCQSPPSVERKSRMGPDDCQSPSPSKSRFTGLVKRGRRLAFEQSGIPESLQSRVHSLEGVEDIEEGWSTPKKLMLVASDEVCPPAPKKPQRRPPRCVELSSVARRIDFDTAARIFSFNARRRVMLDEPNGGGRDDESDESSSPAVIDAKPEEQHLHRDDSRQDCEPPRQRRCLNARDGESDRVPLCTNDDSSPCPSSPEIDNPELRSSSDSLL